MYDLRKLRFELLDIKGYLEDRIKILPLKSRKPIIDRIGRLNEWIKLISLFTDGENGIKP